MNQQEEAASLIKDWYSSPDARASIHGPQQFRLHGYAGTGKTTIARKFPEQLEIPAGDDGLIYAAYTGKAAQVLTKKGCPAQTIHSLIYIPQAKGKADLRRLEAEIAEAELQEDFKVTKSHRKLMQQRDRMAEELSQPGFILNELDSPLLTAKLLVVDECSMVDGDMADDLLSFGCRILILGDPGQLPPIGDPGAFDNDPDYFLTTLYRQEADSPVVELATMARQNKLIRPGKYGDSLAYKPLNRLKWGNYDQIIVGRNATRERVCREIRKSQGRTGWKPEEGDKIIILENNKDLSIVNGAQFDVCETLEAEEGWSVRLLVQDDEGRERELQCWAQPFADGLDGEKEVSRGIDYSLRQTKAFATWGQAITCHKSQGSQWDSVLIMDESRVFRKDANRWLYTAITRAAKNVAIIRPV